MSAQAQRNDQPPPNDSEWLEFPDRSEISPASVWASDYEDEITIQSKRVAARQTEKVTAAPSDEPSEGKARPRARILDESQVLPNEASFATVKLHQEFEPTTVDGREHQRTRAVEESDVKRDNSRTRTLDVSHVLPGEVSYATVMFPTGARTYSPLREFSAKSSLNWGKLTAEALLLVSIFAIGMVAFKISRQGVFSSHRTESNSTDTVLPRAETTATQAELPASQPVVSETVSNMQTQVKEPIASTQQTAAKLEAAVEVTQHKSNVALNPEGSRKAAYDEIKLKPSTIPRQEAKSGTRESVSAVASSKRELTNQQRRASVKQSEVNSTPARTERIDVSIPQAQTVGARSASSSTNAAAERPKDASTSAPVTGGGQRPRTVRPKENP